MTKLVEVYCGHFENIDDAFGQKIATVRKLDDKLAERAKAVS